ncbi:hypothetical protein Rsub_11858 [Raphidocelis subcapitata]|uniref:Uncharacterized protein n=1 Tax=Raphidocelis subcapitata TaxID=307507 RepID=A0A2V0PNS6_9CHLO|nr:hypothetical protein Rsub_11858 [Raphidocelis subcapitata]|eukprot:GBF99087.1 hypothetical protein Rsub_11858 [Raphidocelis subcapitata]
MPLLLAGREGSERAGGQAPEAAAGGEAKADGLKWTVLLLPSGLPRVQRASGGDTRAAGDDGVGGSGEEGRGGGGGGGAGGGGGGFRV